MSLSKTTTGNRWRHKSRQIFHHSFRKPETTMLSVCCCCWGEGNYNSISENKMTTREHLRTTTGHRGHTSLCSRSVHNLRTATFLEVKIWRSSAGCLVASSMQQYPASPEWNLRALNLKSAMMNKTTRQTITLSNPDRVCRIDELTFIYNDKLSIQYRS